ncbi:MAG: CBS domain-containing protein [Candidatus Omnitrophica bacterium]|nr:CBS domain-containing protein [Candidatus Omnitrophota bacterium]
MRLFVYLSEILGRNVCDARNHVVGKIYDVSMRMSEEVFPRTESILVRRGFFKKEYAKIPIADCADLGRPLRLKISKEKVVFQEEKIRSTFSLCRHILDQQVVDINDQKVVRVNDVHLLRIDNQFHLAHVDIGIRGIIRRLEWNKMIDGVVRLFAPDSSFLTQEDFISWKNTQVLTIGRSHNVLRSNMARQKLSRIPPTQLAEIMEDLDVFEKVSLFKSFSVDMQHKVFTDMALQEKEELIDQLSNHDAVRIIENIPKDEATDLLLNLPKDKMMNLLRLMKRENAMILKKLLGFEKDSAGGLMTTEYLSLPEDSFVKDALQEIKNNVEKPVNLFHIYIVDNDNRLLGSTSLRNFINADLNTPITETCFSYRIFVRTDDDIEEVALILEKYKFSSIPVLNEDDILQGVITIDDVVEELISIAWKKYDGQL